MLRRRIEVPRITGVGKRSWADLVDCYNESIDWYADYTGINVMSRFRDYRKQLSELRLLQYDAARDFFKDPLRRAAFFEADWIVSIFPPIRQLSMSIEIPKNKLKDLNQGTFSYVDRQTKDDTSRNTLYELYIAGRVTVAGLPVKLSENRSDIETTFEGHTVFIECKRATSEREFIPRIKHGLKQLRGRYTPGKTMEFGFVYVCTDVLANPGLEIINVETFEESQKRIHDDLTPLLDRYRLSKDYVRPHKKSVAIMGTIREPMMIETLGLPILPAYTHFASTFDTFGDTYFQLMERFHVHLARENAKRLG